MKPIRMKRDAALRVIAKHYPDGIVVPVYQSAFDWMVIRPHALNYLCTGAMGQASSHALGLALGAPDEKIVVLDGDGSLLMNLSALVTVGNEAPDNFVHFVSNNGIYEVNGEFPLPMGQRCDLEGIAREAGYVKTWTIDNTDDLDAAMPEILNTRGPVFVCLKVETGESHPRDYVAIHSAESRQTFRVALKQRLKL